MTCILKSEQILSPSSIDYDRTQKKELYQRSGVREYWIVDPFEHTVEQFVLKDNSYHCRTVSNEVHPQFVDNIVIDLREVCYSSSNNL